MKYLLALIFFLFNVSVVSAISYSDAFPSNFSIVFTTDINYTISYTGVNNVTSAILSVNPRSTKEKDFINYTVINVDNQSSNLFLDFLIFGDIFYKWYINDSGDISESGTYKFTTGSMTSIIMFLGALASFIPSLLTLILVFVPIIVFIAVIGLIKGWFRKGGILDFKKLMVLIK